jgi:hypothetical protein
VSSRTPNPTDPITQAWATGALALQRAHLLMICDDS